MQCRPSLHHFEIIMGIIMDIEDKERQFSKDLQKFAGQKDFTGFHSDLATRLVDWLTDVMDDKGEAISWWLWDCPERGLCEEESHMTIRENDKVFVLRTTKDLYEYLTYLSKERTK